MKIVVPDPPVKEPPSKSTEPLTSSVVLLESVTAPFSIQNKSLGVDTLPTVMVWPVFKANDGPSVGPLTYRVSQTSKMLLLILVLLLLERLPEALLAKVYTW